MELLRFIISVLLGLSAGIVVNIFTGFFKKHKKIAVGIFLFLLVITSLISKDIFLSIIFQPKAKFRFDVTQVQRKSDFFGTCNNLDKSLWFYVYAPREGESKQDQGRYHFYKTNCTNGEWIETNIPIGADSNNDKGEKFQIGLITANSDCDMDEELEREQVRFVRTKVLLN
jgi:hypothetical protein